MKDIFSKQLMHSKRLKKKKKRAVYYGMDGDIKDKDGYLDKNFNELLMKIPMATWFKEW